MRPDLSNYEIWIMDYLDGKLNQQQVADLLAFLADNPSVREEFQDLEAIRISASAEEFSHKESLRRNMNDLSEKQFELLCVADIENDLSIEEHRELREIIASDKRRKSTYDLITKTKLTPPVLKYNRKNRLYRLSPLQKSTRIVAAVLSIAATLLILITVLNKGQEITEPVITIASFDPSKPEIPDENKITSPVNPATRIKPDKINDKNLEVHKSSESSTLLAGNETDQAGKADTVIRSDIPQKIKSDPGQEIALSTIPEPSELNVLTTTNITVADFYNTEPTENKRSLTDLFREKILKSGQPEKEKLKAFDIAGAGINGVNRLLGWEMTLEKNSDNKGNVRSVSFNSKLLKFNAPVKKSEPLE